MRKINCLKELVPRFKQYIQYGIQVYTLSCCEDYKNEHLHTNYAQEYLLLKKEFIPHYYLNERVLLIGEVIYDSRQQKRIIRKMFAIYLKSKDDLVEKQLALFMWLTIIMSLMKPSKFRPEKECRFINIEICKPNSPKLATRQCIKQIPLEPWEPWKGNPLF